MTDPIVIVMDGGLIQEIANIPPGVVIEVRDFDVEGTTDETHITAEGDEYTATIWTHEG
jgi:hypothetical protein